jgi:hypothetical protein
MNGKLYHSFYKQAVFVFVFALFLAAQSESRAQALVNSGMHEHITFKNFIYAIPRPAEFNAKIKAMGGIDKILNDSSLLAQALQLLEEGHRTNWEIHDNRKSEKKKRRAYPEWNDSHWKNYSQTNYTHLKSGGFKYIVTSYTPPEKPNMQSGFQLLLNRVQSKMPWRRLKEIQNPAIPHYEEFLAEYYYTLLTAAQKHDGKYPFRVIDNLKEFNEVKLVNQSAILASIEGAHVLHGSYYYKNKHYKTLPLYRYTRATDEEWGRVLNKDPRTISKSEKSDRANIDKMNLYINGKIQADLLAYVDSMRALTPRLHFITGAHFAYNDMFGNDKALDKENRRWLAQTGASIGFMHRMMFYKPSAGITPVVFQLDNGAAINNQRGAGDSARAVRIQVEEINMGQAVLDALFDVKNIQNSQWKPIYFDLKHSDELTFLEFCAYREKFQKEYGKRIPLFVSHVAANGENFKVSLFTSQSPLYDRYKELTKNDKFYHNKTVHGWRLRHAKVVGEYNHLLKRMESLDPNDFSYAAEMKEVMKKMYPNGVDPLISEKDLPKADSITTTTIINSISFTLGWFNPWSVNLSDEQIRYICNEGGMIGVMLEDRLLGRTTMRYRKKSIRRDGVKKDENLYHDGAIRRKLDAWNKANGRNLDHRMLLSVAPLWRNLLYMAEKGAGGSIDSVTLDKKVWDHFCIGSDYDGYVNPIDIAPTNAKIPELKNTLISHFDAFIDMYDVAEYKSKSGVSTPSQVFAQRWGISVKEVVAKIFESNLPVFLEEQILR